MECMMKCAKHRISMFILFLYNRSFAIPIIKVNKFHTERHFKNMKNIMN